MSIVNDLSKLLVSFLWSRMLLQVSRQTICHNNLAIRNNYSMTRLPLAITCSCSVDNCSVTHKKKKDEKELHNNELKHRFAIDGRELQLIGQLTFGTNRSRQDPKCAPLELTLPDLPRSGSDCGCANIGVLREIRSDADSLAW